MKPESHKKKSVLDYFLDEISEVIVAVVVGFAEDRMMDIITSRAPPPALT